MVKPSAEPRPAMPLDAYIRPMVTARATDAVDEVRRKLRRLGPANYPLDGVALVGPDGDFLADISLFDLVTSSASLLVGSLAFDSTDVHARLDQSVNETIMTLLDAQRRSLVVVDDTGRPVGRVHAADLVKHLRTRRRTRRLS